MYYTSANERGNLTANLRGNLAENCRIFHNGFQISAYNTGFINTEGVVLSRNINFLSIL